MFDAANPKGILQLEDHDLARLPNAEDDLYEYKSSRTKDTELADKITKAASAFWNGGGGLFVVGVDGQGQPDGGISLLVGRQPRREWIDSVIGRVTPRGKYVVQCVENTGLCPAINPNNAVVLIGFGESEIGPHMAPDHRFYVRTGALTVPANQFLVESLWARRNRAKPRIVHIAKVDPYSTETDEMTIELVAVTSAPALDVEIDFHEKTEKQSLRKFQRKVTLIDLAHSYAHRIHVRRTGITMEIDVKYRDLSGNEYNYNAKIDSLTAIPSGDQSAVHLERISKELADIRRALERRS
jgi:hypothetical protein